jgi:hypothetical protein
MKILMVCWYDPGEGIYPAYELLSRHYQVQTFPYLVEKQGGLLSLLSNQQFDVILFWAMCVSEAETFRLVREKCPHSKIVLFNWDDPHAWTISCNQMTKRAPYIDLVLTSSAESVPWYLKNGSKKAIVCYPTYSPNRHRFEPSPEYKCDISFICTNLYTSSEFNTQLLSRKGLLDSIYKLHCEGRIQFDLYGFPFLQDHYPRCYKRQIVYEENYKVFSSSRICLNQHVYNGDQYLNERTITIMASGGVMLVDRIRGIDTILRDGYDCLMYSSIDECIDKMRMILGREDLRQQISINARSTAERLFSQDQWLSKFNTIRDI